MNIVLDGKHEMSYERIFEEICMISPNLEKAIKPTDIDIFVESRLEGDMCKCRGNGEFNLLPLEDEAVQSGQKRYMTCYKCGGYSHL